MLGLSPPVGDADDLSRLDNHSPENRKVGVDPAPGLPLATPGHSPDQCRCCLDARLLDRLRSRQARYDYLHARAAGGM